MPSATIDKIIKTCGLSKKKVETYWKDAKGSAKKQGFKEGDNNFYAYVMGIVKRRLSDSCIKKLGWETTSDIISNSIVPQPTKEMFDFYHKRTNEHIQRVQNNLKSILDYLPNSIDKGTLLQRVKEHDKSKYSEEEYIPYTWNTWNYKCEQEKIPFKLSKEVKKEFDNAWKHHYTVNFHHPEYYKDPSFMTNEDLIEMMCDHMAMSQELNNPLREWEDDNINKRWKFKPEQVKFIYKLVDIFEKLEEIAMKKEKVSSIISSDIILSSSDISKYISLAKKEVRDLLNDGMSKEEMKIQLRDEDFTKLAIDSLLEGL